VAVAAGGGCAGDRWSNVNGWCVWKRSWQQQQRLSKGSNSCGGGEPPGLRLWRWQQKLAAYIEDELIMLMSFDLQEKQVLLLLSNQIMQICTDLLAF
jgi:hypothetical protein